MSCRCLRLNSVSLNGPQDELTRTLARSSALSCRRTVILQLPVDGTNADASAVPGSRAEAVWRAELARQTLATLLVELGASISPVVIGKTAAWIQERAR